VGRVINQHQVARKVSNVGQSLRLEYERTRDNAGKQATPRLMVTENTLAQKRPTIIDWNRQSVKSTANQNRTHVCQIGRQEEIENLK
jgi:hypothetical protein